MSHALRLTISTGVARADFERALDTVVATAPTVVVTVTNTVADAATDTAVRGVVVVSGTDTGVGKTIVTAAIAAAATAQGLRVAVLKPAQTGIPPGSPEESDVDTVVRLAAPAGHRTLVTYPDPLAPLAAARTAGQRPLSLRESLDAVRALATAYDLVLVEGAGGLLVPMGIANAGPWTVADLAGVAGAQCRRGGPGRAGHAQPHGPDPGGAGAAQARRPGSWWAPGRPSRSWCTGRTWPT